MNESLKGSERKRSLAADLSLLLVALFWGGGFVVIKNALNDMSPLFLMAIRFTAAFLIMSLVFFKKFIKITRKDIKSGAIIGLFLFAAYATQTIGLKYTTASKQAFLTGTNVVIVPFITWIIYKTSPGWHAIIGALLSCIGIWLLTLKGSSIAINYGDILTLICAVFFASHIASVGYFAKDSDPVALSIVQTGVAAVIFVISAFVFEPIPRNVTGTVAFALSYLVMLSTIAAILIQNIAQKYTPSTHAAIILCMESVFGTLLAVLILKDKLNISGVIGCILIFIAILLTETKFSFLKRAAAKGEA